MFKKYSIKDPVKFKTQKNESVSTASSSDEKKKKRRKKKTVEPPASMPPGYNTDQEFRFLLVGPSASGKSTLIKKVLHEQLRGRFNEIFIMAPTIKQPLYAGIKLRDENEHKTDECTNAKLTEWIELIQENGENNKRTLLILDDIINTELTLIRSVLCTEILRLRHYKCSIIIASQNYKGVPPFIRTNVSAIAMFISPNRDELKKLQQELGDRFMERYTEIVKEKYQYIFVDFTKHELEPDRYTNVARV